MMIRTEKIVAKNRAEHTRRMRREMRENGQDDMDMEKNKGEDRRPSDLRHWYLG